MKKVKLFVLAVICQAFIAQAAMATVWVTNNSTNTSNLNGLVGLNASINSNGSETANAAISPTSSYADRYDLAVKFVTEQYCNTYPGYCNTLGISGVNDNTITLSSRLRFSNPDADVLIGNENYYDTSAGFIFIDTRSYTEKDDDGNILTNSFRCNTNQNYGFRNTVILTTGLNRADVASLDCVTFEYDVYVCGGDFNPDITPGNAGWCPAATVDGNDNDGDGYIDADDGGDDCDDDDDTIFPGAPEIPDDGIDQDCDGQDGGCSIEVTPLNFSMDADLNTSTVFNVTLNNHGGYDRDGSIVVSGFGAGMAANGNSTLADGEDQDVTITITDGVTPNGDYTLTFSAQSVSVAGGLYACGKDVDLEVTNSTDAIIDNDNDGSPSDEDCDDNDPNNFPGNPEICDGQDNDCDNLSDEDFSDLDGDGIGDECDDDADGDTFDDDDIAIGGDDCNDADATINPDAVEIIGDGIDNDCDGEIDECDDNTNTYFVDADGDGFGDANGSIDVCGDDDPGQGFSDNGDDCNDTNANINPNAVDLCDGIDNDCDGEIDEGVLGQCTVDDDGDGFCEAIAVCDDGSQPGDCNDDNAAINPNATEECSDGIDNNCDGLTDAADLICNISTGGDPDEEVDPAEVDAFGFPLSGGSCGCDITASTNGISVNQMVLAFMAFIPVFLVGAFRFRLKKVKK